MQVTRFNQAKPYQAPGHHNMVGLRLQGAEASQTDNFWVGYSQFLPAGGTDYDSSPLEKVYVILEGELVVTTNYQEVTLSRLDSCHIGANQKRQISNRTNQTVCMLVVMPNPRNAHD